LAGHRGFDQAGKYRVDSEYSTYRKCRGVLSRLTSFCEARHVRALDDVGVETLEDFRRSRVIDRVTWKGERQGLVTFFGYCVSHKWIATNPAKELKVVPYTLQEESQILEACSQIGGGPRQRKRLAVRAAACAGDGLAAAAHGAAHFRRFDASEGRRFVGSGWFNVAGFPSHREDRAARLPSVPRRAQAGARCSSGTARRHH